MFRWPIETLAPTFALLHVQRVAFIRIPFKLVNRILSIYFLCHLHKAIPLFLQRYIVHLHARVDRTTHQKTPHKSHNGKEKFRPYRGNSSIVKWQDQR